MVVLFFYNSVTFTHELVVIQVVIKSVRLQICSVASCNCNKYVLKMKHPNVNFAPKIT